MSLVSLFVTGKRGASGDVVEMMAVPLCPTAPHGPYPLLGQRFGVGVAVYLLLLCLLSLFAVIV